MPNTCLLRTFSNPLDNALLTKLRTEPISDATMEQALTQIRYEFLKMACSQECDYYIPFYLALAQQCFINEYVFCVSNEELQLLANMRQKPLSDLQYVALACYEMLQPPFPDIPELCQPYQQQQQELQLRQSIKSITPIQNDISRLVQQHYEQHPYPRWVSLPHYQPCLTLQQYVQHPELTNPAKPIQVLVAGCGTGQHPVSISQQLPNCEILAIDLSLNSLSYAKRITQALAINNIDYAQADILKLATLALKFDVIESIGVIQHLQDPWQGCLALLKLLKPGGVIKLGLYSKVGRHAIIDTVKTLKEQGCNSTHLQQCRHEILQHPIQYHHILNSPDFYTSSTCRDLLFHVYEHHFTLTEIMQFIAQQQLKFLHFELEPAMLQRYREHYPSDERADNLHNWLQFEQLYPDCFGGMYKLWLQKSS